MKPNEKPIELGDISSITNEEWLKWRKHGPHYDDMFHPDYIPVTVTGSEAAIITGDSPYQSNIDLAHQKTSDENQKVTQEKQEIFDAGHIFEPFVAINFMRYMKKEFPKVKIKLEKDIIWETFTYLEQTIPFLSKKSVKAITEKLRALLNDSFTWKPNVMYQCGAKDSKGNLIYPHAIVDTDGFLNVNGHWGILECKTTQSYEIKDMVSNGICPAYYEAQCRHSMAVMNMDFVYIVFCWGWTLNEMAVIRIDRDMAIEEELMRQEQDFCECVELGIEPDPTNQKASLLNLSRLKKYGMPKKKPSPVELPDTCMSLVLEAAIAEEKLEMAKKQVEEIIQSKEKILSRLYDYFQDADYGTIRLNEHQIATIKIKASKHRDSFDLEKFKTEEPALYKQYLVQSEVFDEKSFTKENKALKQKYIIPGQPKEDVAPNYELTIKDVPL